MEAGAPASMKTSMSPKGKGAQSNQVVQNPLWPSPEHHYQHGAHHAAPHSPDEGTHSTANMHADSPSDESIDSTYGFDLQTLDPQTRQLIAQPVAPGGMLPILDPLPVFGSPDASPTPDSEGQKRKRKAVDSDEHWSDTPRSKDEPMPRWMVSGGRARMHNLCEVDVAAMI
jgi:hypothetical protein